MKTFNRRFKKLSIASWRTAKYYDALNMRSHDIDSDSSGGYDFNPMINYNLFGFMFTRTKEVFVYRDSRIWR